MNAQEILQVPADSPESLFGPDLEKDIKTLLKKWHPDVNSNPVAGKVTAHINVLAAIARSRPYWRPVASPPGVNTKYVTGNGKTVRFSFRKKVPFELGSLYYGDGLAVWEIESTYASLFTSGVTTVSTLHYADEKMKAEFARYVPNVASVTADSLGTKKYAIMRKPPRTYPLRDVIRVCGGVLSPEHAAWVLSSLLNICCFLQWNRISHGDVSVDSVFVSPEAHSVHLLGGWWYATRFGEEVTHLPVRSARLAPREVREQRLAAESTDLLLTRALIREALGDQHGTGFPQPVPPAMASFLRAPSSGIAPEDYQTWKSSVLPASFDARRFVKLEINDGDVFKE